MIKRPESISDVIFYLVPISMALTYALKYYESLTGAKLDGLSLVIPALFIASGTAVSLEFVGIKAGHTATDYAEAKDYLRALVAGSMLVAYCVISLLSFEGLLAYESGLVLIVAMAYPLKGLSKAYSKRETAVSEAKATRREDAGVARERADEERIRQEKREDDRIVRQEVRDHETNLLRIENERQAKADDIRAKATVAVERAKARQVENENRKSKAKVVSKAKVESGSKVKVESESEIENRNLVESLLRQGGISHAEIGRRVGLSGQRVGQIKKELNGTIKQ